MVGTERRRSKKVEEERRRLEREIQELRRQLPGLDSLLEFFRAAGVRLELGRGRWLWVNGVQAKHLTHLSPADTLEWNSIVNKISLKQLLGKFFQAIAANARFGCSIALVPRENGFAVMRGDVRLGVIHAARAQGPHREARRGNFLIPGKHWQLLADVVRDAERELIAESKRHEEARAVEHAS